jgi:hypothetical protein
MFGFGFPHFCYRSSTEAAVETSEENKSRRRHFPTGTGCSWYRVHKSFLDVFLPIIGKDGVVLYSVLCRHSHDERVANRTAEWLARKSATSRTNVFKLLKALEEHELVQRQRTKGRASEYLLLDTLAAIDRTRARSSTSRRDSRLEPRAESNGACSVSASGGNPPIINRCVAALQPTSLGDDGDIWRTIKQTLKGSIDPISFDVFFRDTVFSHVSEGVLYILVQDESAAVGFEKFGKRIWPYVPAGLSGIQILPPRTNVGREEKR